MSTQNFELGAKILLGGHRVNSTTISKWKLQHVNVVTFHSKLRMRHEYNHWRDFTERNAYKQ